jgi:hypothetical protein
MQFAIIPVVSPPSNAIAHGSLDAVMEHIVDSQARSDAEDLLTRAAEAVGSLETIQAQKDQLFARSIQALNDSLGHLTRRMDALETRRADDARRVAEQNAAREQQAREAEEELEAEPPPGYPQDAVPALELEDEVPPPGGELHAHPPPEKPDLEDDEYDPPEFPGPEPERPREPVAKAPASFDE